MTTAIEQLEKSRADLNKLETQAAALRAKIVAAREVVQQAQQPSAELAALRLRRRKVLFECLQSGDFEPARKFDQELADAETNLQAVNLRIEAASVAVEEFERQHNELQPAIRSLLQDMSAQAYRAAVERANIAVAGYREAAEQFAKAHAKLQAACLCADEFANPQEGRIFTIGNGGVVRQFAVGLPALPGTPTQLSFDVGSLIADELIAAMADIGADDIAEQARQKRISNAAADAEREMQEAIAELDR